MKNDFGRLKSILKEEMIILYFGCGTGTISKGIAKILGKEAFTQGNRQ